MKRITIKVGSTFFIDDNGKINKPNIKSLAEQISKIKQSGYDVCLVSSGAIAVGVKKMQLPHKPTETDKKQALAAIGQMSLMQIYEQIFEDYNLKCAQILLSHDDFGNRDRINNLTKTLDALFDYGVVPIINENDAVAVAEIKVGDNDTLSAMSSLAIQASLLVLVSDVNGLYTANPNTNSDAKFIPVVENIDESILGLAKNSSSQFGTGGMITKIRAAQIANSAGTPLMIVNKTKINELYKVVEGENIGTYFKENKKPMPLKKCWIKFCANVKGQICCDDGAVEAIKNHKSLLSCGITKVGGDFGVGSIVDIVDNNQTIIARGVTNFSSSQIKQFSKDEIENQLIVHANNIVVL